MKSQPWSLKELPLRHQALMNRFWEKMHGSYGSNWGNNFGQTPNREWTEALAQHQEWVVAEGLKDCLLRDTKWPPMLPEFISMCRDVSAHRNPAKKKKQLENFSELTHGPKSPGGRAYTDTLQSKFDPGEPGYVEFFNEREIYWKHQLEL
jgi:hypothetical protein